jgi:IPT/TIG domain/Regulator of chromosome condensation (RCC1) repeat
LDSVAGLCTTRFTHRRLVVSFVAAFLLALGVAAPAQAHEYFAKAWGSNDFGELGIGPSEGPEKCGTELHACSATPLQVKGLRGVSAVSNGEAFAIALLEETGTVVAWGFNGGGQLGDGSTTGPETCEGSSCSRTPVAVKELSSVKAIAAGNHHSLALLSNGTIMAWGSGALGAGTTASSDVPVAVCAPAPEPCPGSHLSGVKAIAAGDGHSVALLENDTVMAWGENEHGQLGDATTTSRNVPVAVKELSGVKAIAAGGHHSLAVLENGKVMAWGWNVRGELGDGLEADSNVPVAVCAPGTTAPCATHLEGATAVAAGQNHSLALLQTQGKAVAWGANEAGQLGDGNSTGPEKCAEVPIKPCAKVPVQVSGLGGATMLSAGLEHSLALLENGRVMAWGLNRRGQLGDATSTGPEPCEAGACSRTPGEVCATGAGVTCKGTGPYLEGAIGIAGGGEFSLAFVESPPTVLAVSPNKGPKAGGTVVTVTGTEFSHAITVRFGAESRPFKVNSQSSITVVSPPGSGTVDVTVTNRVGTSATTPADQFHYAPPRVKTISPKKGPASGGTAVTITGENFTGASAVEFGANNATGFKVNSDRSITAVSPASTAKIVDVTVTTPSGTSQPTKKDHFKYRVSSR